MARYQGGYDEYVKQKNKQIGSEKSTILSYYRKPENTIFQAQFKNFFYF